MSNSTSENIPKTPRIDMDEETEIETLVDTATEKTQESQAQALIPTEEPGIDDENLREEDPFMILAMLGVSLYMAKLWLDDFLNAKKGEPNPNAFPGATACGAAGIWVAVIVSLVLLGIETGGEYALGISEEQSDITWIFLLSMISAAFIEELIFRGFLVVENKGKALFLLGVVGFSFLFAIFHPLLWHMDFAEDVPTWQFWNADFSFDFSVKAIFSTSMIFVGSLWFYVVRFYALNPNHSLIPCMAAHLAKNVGVFVIKLAQGHVVGLY